MFKVIVFGASQKSKASVDFSLVINSNLGPISHCFWDTVAYWLKIASFSPPPSHLVPSLAMTIFEFLEKVYGS